MLVGVVSDTHGHAENARKAAHMLASMEVDAVLHCGDVGSEAIVPIFSGWPSHFVLGNVDQGSEAVAIAKSIAAAGQICHNRFGSIVMGGVKIALLHGDDGRRLDQTIASGEHALVCHGHTHVPRRERVGTTLVLNPGALYRATRHTIAIVALPEMRAEILEV
jgi:putative phosphoesterase